QGRGPGVAQRRQDRDGGAAPGRGCDRLPYRAGGTALQHWYLHPRRRPVRIALRHRRSDTCSSAGVHRETRSGSRAATEERRRAEGGTACHIEPAGRRSSTGTSTRVVGLFELPFDIVDPTRAVAPASTGRREAAPGPRRRSGAGQKERPLAEQGRRDGGATASV